MDSSTGALMQEIRFNQEDLKANRSGQLSEVQHYTLRVRRRQAIFLGVVILIVVAFIATLMIFLGTRDNGSTILAMLGIGMTLCTAALAAIFGRYWLRLTADIRGQRVMISQGSVERVIKPVTRRVVNYMIRVGDAEVFVSKEAFDIFEHDRPYVLYRAPYTGLLLSVEALE